MANAVANFLGQKVILLLPTNPALGGDAGHLKLVFRESKIQKAVVVFDECEVVFASREQISAGARRANFNALLSEIEQHDGLVILCTNRPSDIDAAMHRRITLATAFRDPGPFLREKIWRSHMPKGVTLAPDVDLKRIGMDFDLNGGFIKNSCLAAAAAAVRRDPVSVCINHNDIVTACSSQVRGQVGDEADLYAAGLTEKGTRTSDVCLAPSRGNGLRVSLDEIIAPPACVAKLKQVAAFEKRRSALHAWGFGGGRMPATCVVISGPRGSGKHAAAEALADAINRPIQRLDAALLVASSTGNGDRSIRAALRDARNGQNVLVLDKAGVLLLAGFDPVGGNYGADDGGDGFWTGVATGGRAGGLVAANTGALGDAVRSFPGMVVLIVPTPSSNASTGSSSDVVHAAVGASPWVLFHVQMPALGKSARAALWRASLPQDMPIDASDEPDFAALAEAYPRLGARHIRNAIARAAAAAISRMDDESGSSTPGSRDVPSSSDGHQHTSGVSMTDLAFAAGEETARSLAATTHRTMFS